MEMEIRKIMGIILLSNITIKITIILNNITNLPNHHQHLIQNNNQIPTIYKYNTIEAYGNNICHRISNYYKYLKYKYQTLSA
jgi:hypothetical protein